ncbi:MAG: hypothetical protein QM765_35280 [Myxococcales bacterium]
MNRSPSRSAVTLALASALTLCGCFVPVNNGDHQVLSLSAEGAWGPDGALLFPQLASPQEVPFELSEELLVTVFRQVGSQVCFKGCTEAEYESLEIVECGCGPACTCLEVQSASTDARFHVLSVRGLVQGPAGLTVRARHAETGEARDDAFSISFEPVDRIQLMRSVRGSGSTAVASFPGDLLDLETRFLDRSGRAMFVAALPVDASLSGESVALESMTETFIGSWRGVSSSSLVLETLRPGTTMVRLSRKEVHWEGALRVADPAEVVGLRVRPVTAEEVDFETLADVDAPEAGPLQDMVTVQLPHDGTPPEFFAFFVLADGSLAVGGADSLTLSAPPSCELETGRRSFQIQSSRAVGGEQECSGHGELRSSLGNQPTIPVLVHPEK